MNKKPLFTLQEIESALTNEDSFVRWQWGKRLDFLPTEIQVERGLTDEDWGVRTVWGMRQDFTATEEQVERGLTDENSDVRWSWVEREDFTPTETQIERGFRDTDEDVRQAWRLRPNLFVSLEGLERIVLWSLDIAFDPLPPEDEKRLRDQAKPSEGRALKRNVR